MTNKECEKGSAVRSERRKIFRPSEMRVFVSTNEKGNQEGAQQDFRRGYPLFPSPSP